MQHRCNVLGRTGENGQWRLQSCCGACGSCIPCERLFTEPARVAPYESDALTSFRRRPEAVVLARDARGGHRDRPRLPPRARPVRGARQRHQPVGRLAAGRGRHRDRPQPPQPDPAARPGGARRGGRARRDQRARHARGRRTRAVLRARPVEPVDLHDRRQHRLQLGRRALPQARDDGQPRARRRGRAARRRGRAARSGAGRPTGSAASSGPRGCSGSRSRRRCGCCRCPRPRTPCSPPIPTCARPATRSPRWWRPGCCRWRWRSWTSWRSRPPSPRSSPGIRRFPRC